MSGPVITRSWGDTQKTALPFVRFVSSSVKVKSPCPCPSRACRPALCPGLRTVGGQNGKKPVDSSHWLSSTTMAGEHRESKKAQLALALALAQSKPDWARTNQVPESLAFRWAKDRKLTISTRCRYAQKLTCTCPPLFASAGSTELSPFPAECSNLEGGTGVRPVSGSPTGRKSGSRMPAWPASPHDLAGAAENAGGSA